MPFLQDTAIYWNTVLTNKQTFDLSGVKYHPPPQMWYLCSVHSLPDCGYPDTNIDLRAFS